MPRTNAPRLWGTVLLSRACDWTAELIATLPRAKTGESVLRNRSRFDDSGFIETGAFSMMNVTF